VRFGPKLSLRLASCCKVLVVNVVTLKPYGKDWKAALPSEIQAQIDDLIESALQEILLPLVTRSRHAVRLHTENASARESRSNSKIAKRKKAALKH